MDVHRGVCCALTAPVPQVFAAELSVVVNAERQAKPKRAKEVKGVKAAKLANQAAMRVRFRLPRGACFATPRVLLAPPPPVLLLETCMGTRRR